MRQTLRLIFFLVIMCSTTAYAALNFPLLTGRVVDDAHILSQSTIEEINSSLSAYENGTSNQVVVVTLPSLQGTSIEDYGYQLGRYWQIGQKEKNNGVLLILAPKEHKVRIEVGYGLEPLLTDAISSTIINSIIVPNFHSGNIEQGVVLGTKAIISVLGGNSIPAEYMQSTDNLSPTEIVLILLFVFWFAWFAIRHPFILAIILSNSSSRFGGSDRGGFSGGGGSFGGGGASGSW